MTSSEPEFIVRPESRIITRQPEQLYGRLEHLNDSDVFVTSVGLNNLVGRVVTAEIGDGCIIFVTPDGLRHELPPLTVGEFAAILRQMADRLIRKHYIDVVSVEATDA